MIVFQLTPCRLYPKIVKLIKQQFSKATHIHEVFCLKDKYKPNPLKITDNNHIFEDQFFLYGIFDEKKVIKNEGDFWFTIEIPKNKVLYEYFAAVKYFGSEEFLSNTKKWGLNSGYDKMLYELWNPLQNIKEKKFIDLVQNKDNIINHKLYKIRKNIIPSKKNLDYIGSFNNWSKTIKDIKEIVGLDLTSLINEKVYSYGTLGRKI